MTKTAKTATIGAVAVAVAVSLLAFSAMAASAQTVTTTTTSASQTTGSYDHSIACNHQNPDSGASSQWGGVPSGHSNEWSGWFGRRPATANLSVGQTITITSTSGQYTTAGSSGANGTASGTMTFTVTAKLTSGYTLTLATGSLTVAGTTYTISTGSAQLDPTGTTISGQGTTSPAGTFIIFAFAHGTFAGTTGSVSMDFAHGTAEYYVTLNGSVTG